MQQTVCVCVCVCVCGRGEGGKGGGGGGGVAVGGGVAQVPPALPPAWPVVDTQGPSFLKIPSAEAGDMS